ncbi:MAG: arginine--tRNA ligase [Pseudomonadaceae bacterium]|nr:arginine--tRNA ligase [Pseudomonadaceae bacterium]
MIYNDIRSVILAGLEVLQAAGVVPQGVDLSAVVVEAPKEASHGDLATNAAMVLAKPAGKAPRVIAEALAEELRKDARIAAVEVAGPGFVNIRLQPEVLLAEAAEVMAAGREYGKAGISGGRKALVEYVSINPTGPVHVGHGRNAVFGDAIAALLEKAGFPVYREYLVNDAGNQIRVLVRSLHARYRQLFGEDVAVPADGYPGEYLVEIAEALKARDDDKWLAVTDENELFEGLRAFAVEKCLAMIQADMETLGIRFDNYFSEHAMHQTGAMDEVVAMLREKGLVYEGTLPPPKGKEVADYQPVELTLFRATAFGLPEDQAVYNREGRPTYFGQDIAYHWNKFRRGYDYLPVVIDVRQVGSAKPLGFAVEAMTGKSGVYQPVLYEMVNVMRDGVPVKLSKRAGNIVALKDVLEEIGSDAFRFSMLTVKPTTIMVFDLAKAAEKTMENPVFYVQYAHARLCAVRRMATEAGLMLPEVSAGQGAARVKPAAAAVLKQVMLYPAVVEQAARKLEPHRLAFYAQELAGAVHSWYADEKFVDADDLVATSVRLQVADAARVVLADALRVCGVSAPERM